MDRPLFCECIHIPALCTRRIAQSGSDNDEFVMGIAMKRGSSHRCCSIILSNRNSLMQLLFQIAQLLVRNVP